MENTKPIKRHPAIAELSRDHHTGLLLVWKIREGIKKSIEPERIKKYVVHSFENELQPHFKEEEELLFNKIDKENKLRLQAEADHAAIRQMAGDMKNGSLSSYESLQTLANRLEKHIRFEERELFNFIQEDFSDADLSEIASSLNDKPKEQNTLAWTDEFWERHS
jgi:hemerythrin-like domain-containing protein